MSKYITKQQYNRLSKIPRDRLSTRPKIFCGTLVEHKGKILLVQEDNLDSGFDFPGGKLLWGENVEECAIREFREEAGYNISLGKLLGVFQRTCTEDDLDFFRIIFTGSINTKSRKVERDETIKKVKWVSIKDILNNKVKLRSKQVLLEVKAFADGVFYPTNVIKTYNW